MTRVHLDGCRLHAPGEEALQLRVDRAILFRYGIPRWLGSPTGGGRLLGGERDDIGCLRRVQLARHTAVDSVGEVVHDSRFAQLREPVRDYHTGTCRWCRERLRQSREILAGVRSARS